MNLPDKELPVKSKDKSWRLLAWMIRVSAFVYIAALGSLMYLETKFVYPGADSTAGDWKHEGVELEEVSFPTADGGELYGYFFEHKSPRGTILFCHGNGENIAMNAPEMALLREYLQVNVLTFDYRGFGKSSGVPSEKTVLADADAAIEWLCEKTDQDSSELIVFGRSLGGGVAAYLAKKYQPKLLVLDRTFSSTVDVGAATYWMFPVRLVMRNRYPSAIRIKKYDGPLLQMHGDVDEVIPLWSGQKLFEASPSPNKEFMLVKGLHHNDPWPIDFLDNLSKFIQSTNDSLLESTK